MVAKTKNETPPPALPVGPLLKHVLSVAWRSGKPALLEGPTGIGKSEVCAQMAEELGIEFRVLDLSLLEPPDLVGLPVIEQEQTRYAPPSFLPTGGKGILMLEELNRAEPPVRQPALQLLTARRLHEYVLPEGWVPFAAINPEDDDYQVTPLDPALRARFLQLRVCADLNCWREWAKQHAVHPAVLDIAQSHDRALETVPPRTWTYVSDVLHKLTPAERDNRILLRATLLGYLPASWAELVAESLGRLDVDDPIDVRVWLETFDTDSSLQAVLWELVESGRTDQLDRLAHRVHEIVKGPEILELVQQKSFRLEAFELLLEMLPGDHREKLQAAFGQNPAAAAALPIKPADLLGGRYRDSRMSKQFKSWSATPQWQHRSQAMVAGLGRHLREKADLPRIRQSRSLLVDLGLIRRDLAPHDKPLDRIFRDLQLEPIPSRA